MAIWTKDSGTLTTNNSYIKYRIRVILESQNVANNTSNVTVQVQVWRTNTGYTTYGTGTVYVNINGTNYSAGITSSHKFSYNSNTQIFSRNLNISHGSDGTKTLNTSARITHSQFTSNSQSFNTALNTIPRASTLSAFSFASNLKPSTAVNLNYTIDRKSTAFRHQIQLRDGSHVVQTWDNVSSNGTTSVQLSATNVNSLLNRMSNVTSRSLTLRVATRSGVSGGWIGGAVTRNATATVDATVKPTVGALTISQTGNSVSTHYLQGKSKITANFTRSAGAGASISSSSIQVRRKSGGADLQTISSNSGTTAKAVSLNGTYEARGIASDSRGRTTHGTWQEFTVTAYSSPRITTFTAIRNATTPTTVNIARAGTHTHLGGSNVLTYTVQRRIGTGSWTNVNTSATGTSIVASFTGSSTSTGNSVTSSYDFRMVITDKFGERAESVVSVSTQRVVLDVHKNEGVGIGKIHEQGVLDVDGPAHFSSGVIVPTSRFTASEPMTSHPEGLSYFVASGSETDGYPTGYYTGLNINPMSHRNAQLLFSNAGERMFFRGYREDTGWSAFTEVAGIERGNSANGDWVKFSDGTLICWHASSSTQNWSWTYGHRFNGGTPKVIAMGVVDSRMWQSSKTETAIVINSNVTTSRQALAIGRWK